MRLHKITLLAVLISCIANVSIWGQDTDKTTPDLNIIFTSNVYNDYFKDYEIKESIGTLSSTYTSLSGSYYLQIGNNAGSNVDTNYLGFKNDKCSIDMRSIYITGNGAKTMIPEMAGWTDSCDGTNVCNAINASHQYDSPSGSIGDAKWHTYKFDTDDVKEIRIYKKVKVVVNNVTNEYGNGESIRIWGIKVCLKPQSPAITSFTVGK